MIRPLRFISLRLLIFLGFSLAAVPFAYALISAHGALEELAAAAQRAAYRVAELSQKKELLRERLNVLERKAKRLAVLEDPESVAAYDESRQEFLSVLANVHELVRKADLKERLIRLRNAALAADAKLFPRKDMTGGNPSAQVAAPTARRRRLAESDALFGEMGSAVRDLAVGFAAELGEEVAQLDATSNRLKHVMVEKASTLMPVSLVIIILVSMLVVRSIKQLDRAIRRLGAGEYAKPIDVSGFQDLQYLGDRLDWLRNRLHSLEEAKQQFIRHVSHEIKTPLATIHEGTDLLADQVVGELNTEQAEIAHILVANTQKLEALIVELINYSQTNYRPGASFRERVQMEKIVAATLEDSQIRLRTKSIRLAKKLTPVTLDGNADQLRTIVDNLLTNAIKYSPVGGEILVSLRQAGGHMILEVEDEGPGIAAEEREQVFEPFYQGRIAVEGGVSGTGLGLAIVSECVAGHHGSAAALEPRTGRLGARVQIKIPLRHED